MSGFGYNVLGFGANASGAAGGASDDEFNRVSFLSHFDGANNGVNNSFDDGSDSNHTITANGNVTQGSFGPFARPDGEWGVSFKGGSYVTSNYLQVAESSDFDFGTGDFTVEFFFFNRAYGAYYDYLVTFGNNVSATTSFGIYIADGTNINLWNNGAIASSTSYNTNQWYHLAVVRASGTVKVYLDGSEIKSASLSSDISSPGGMNVANWRLAGDSQYFNGIISNLRVVKGTAVYTGNFTAPTSKLTAITNTKLLTCQSNRFVDNSATGHTVTPYVIPAVTSFGPFLTSAVYDAAVNGASAYLDGSGDYLQAANSADWDLGTGNFTWECYANIADITRTQWFFSVFSTSSGQNAWGLRLESNGTLNAYFSGDGGESITVVGVAAASSGLTENAWHHIAVVKNGTGSSNIQIYVDGVSKVTGTFGAIHDTNLPFRVGRQGNDTYAQYFLGYISDVRIVKGTAVYTGNFTPPTAPLTAVTNTKLLLNMADGQAIDSAAQNNLTLFGNAKISTGQAKFGDASMVFDGTGDYVTLPSSSFKTFGTGDFTIECFARFDAINGKGLFQLGASYLPSAVTGPAVFASVATNNPWRIYYGTSDVDASVSPSADTWYHVAYVRSSGVTKLYVDGTSVISQDDTTDYTNTFFVIGGGYSSSFLMDGYIDEFRISHMARYTSNFTAPTKAFADKGQ